MKPSIGTPAIADKSRHVDIVPDPVVGGGRYTVESPQGGRRPDGQRMFMPETVTSDQLRRKGPALVVQGDFTPEMFPAHSGFVNQPPRSESIRLAGGPLDGGTAVAARNSDEYSHPVPAAAPTGHRAYEPARYRRTKGRDENGLAVFEYDES